ncbi:MAG: right-handed parallel beta-helix repeat-containing protein, partial [Candidatus Hodarchaeota archaeon]
MKTKLIIVSILIALTTIASVNHLLTINFNLEDTLIIDGQKINIQIQEDTDGLRLILDGKGQSFNFDSFDFIEDLFIQNTIKSISIINSPASNITAGQVINVPFILENDPYSKIANNTIGNFTDSTYTFGIKLVNCPHTEIYNNTIFNVTSTSNSVSGIHLFNSRNTTIRNNTIQKISSTSTNIFNDHRDTYGILVNSSQDVHILNTAIVDLSSKRYTYGILVESSQTTKINDSLIQSISASSSHGIYAVDSDGLITKNNTISNIISSSQASSAISLQNCPSSSVILNNITNLDAQLRSRGVFLEYSENSIVGNNTIESLFIQSEDPNYSSLYGIGLIASEMSLIEWNDIDYLSSPEESEAIGIYAEESKNLIVKNNTISNVTSSFGLFIIKSNDTVISWNVFANVNNWINIDETSFDVIYS